MLGALLTAPAALDAKNGHGKNGRSTEKRATEKMPKRTEREAWPRQTTQGHRPYDENGDGVVTHNEWPGNDAAFRQLDTNHDGILSAADRQFNTTGNRIHDWSRSRR